MSDNGYEIATLDDFRPSAEAVQLPSQNGTDKRVMLRRPDMVRLISSDGNVPDLLTSIVLAQINGRTAEVDVDETTIPQLMQMLNTIAVATFVEPALCEEDEPVDGKLPVAWVSFEDKGFVMSWALGVEAQALQRFRQEPGGNVESVQQVQKVRAKSKRHARAKS